MSARVTTAAVLALLAAAIAPAARAQVAAPVLAPLVTTETATGGGVSVVTRPSVTVDQVTRFRGTARPHALVWLQMQNAATQRWTRVAHVRANSAGAFLARWRPAHIGQFSLRAGASNPLTVTVYKPALATWYGPGFYGNQTACGVPLTPDLQGVAHRTLPCGTLVALSYGGRSVVVPVVDRGPFGVPGAQWDLTQATALTLGLTQTSMLDALRLRTTALPMPMPAATASPQPAGASG